MFRSQVTIAVIMRLVAADPAAAAAHLTKVYEWKYSEAITVAKALAGTGGALILALLVPALAPDTTAPLSVAGAIVVFASAAVAIGVGSLLFVWARRIHLEFLAAETLVGQIVEIRPFLKLYESTRS